MARESTIKIYRSDVEDKPSGLTFGEPALVTTSTAGDRLYIGGTAGNSIWIAAGITDSNRFTVSSASINHVPTQMAVAKHVAGETVTSLNGLTGSIVLSQGTDIGLTTSGNTITISYTGTVPSASNVVNSLNGLTGNIGLTGITSGAVRVVNNDKLDVRIATTGISGVAAFNSTYYTVSDAGLVSPSAPFTPFATSVTGIGFGNSDAGMTGRINLTAGTDIGLVKNGNTITISYTGTVPSASNVVNSLNGLTGNIGLTGITSGAVRVVNNDKLDVRIAGNSLTGVAAFDSNSFDVNSVGSVSIKANGVSNSQLVNSSITLKEASADSGFAVGLGGAITITGTANEIFVQRSSNQISIGLPTDVIITGNLTVNGSVVTSNVETFEVEDPLIHLGKGNQADTVDLGFYASYDDGDERFTGLFRDENDKKYKLFDNLIPQPTTTVNTGHASYRQAELVVRIDGGTF